MSEFFCGLGFALFLITVIGHGIWISVAWILRKLGGPASPQQKLAAEREFSFQELKKFMLAGTFPPELFPLVARNLRGGTVSPEEWARAAQEVLARVPAPTPGVSQPGSPELVGSEEEPVLAVAVEERAPPVVVLPVSESASPPSGVAPAGVAPAGVAPAGALPRSSSTTLHPLDRPEPPPAPPRTPPFKQLLQAFMEERNIRWGEIISGLLIVVCAVGLVVSLWSTLRESVPYLPALIFMVGTGAFHAAGLYTLKKWQLRSVSRAVLVIGVLLIPLNFLAAAALSAKESTNGSYAGPVYWLAVVTGVAAYSAMTYFSGRAILGYAWPKLACVVMVPCIGQLIINRLAVAVPAGDPPPEAGSLLPLGLLPIAGVVGGLAWQLTAIRFRRHLTRRAVFTTLLLLGVSAFALATSIALLLWKTHAILASLAQLSPLLSLAGGMVVVTGLTLRERAASTMGAIRTTGDALALFGAFLLLLTVYVAWPLPAQLLGVAVVNAVLLGTLAWTSSLPLLWAPATICAAFGGLIATRVGRGDLSFAAATSTRQLVDVLLVGVTGVELTAFAGLTTAVAGWLYKQQRRADASVLFLSAGLLGGVSLLVAVKVGFWGGAGASLAAPLFGLYAALILAAAYFLPYPALGATGSVLLLAAIVQLVNFNPFVAQFLSQRQLVVRRPLLFSLLFYANVGAILAAVLGRATAWLHADRLSKSPWRGLITPLGISVLAVTAASLPGIVWVRGDAFGLHAGYAISAAAAWLVIGLLCASPRLWLVFELIVAIAASLVASDTCQRLGKWRGDWFHWDHLLCQMSAVGIACLIWTSLRQALRDRSVGHRLIPESRRWPFADQILIGLVSVSLFGLACLACQPGVLQELGAPTRIFPSAEVAQLAWWTVWLALAALVLSAWERANVWRFAGLILLGTVVPLFFSMRFETDVAVASAVRWGLAVYGILIAALICVRHLILPVEHRHVWRGITSLSGTDLAGLRVLGWLVTATPVITLTLATAILVAQGYRPLGPAAGSWFARIGPTWSFAGPLIIVAISLLLYALRERQAWYMLGGSAVFQYIVTLGYLMPILQAGRAVSRLETLTCWHVNCLGLGLFAAAWLAAQRRLETPALPRSRIRQNRSLLTVQLALMTVASLALPVAATTILFGEPASTANVLRTIGTWPAYLAVLLASAVLYWAVGRPGVGHEAHRGAWNVSLALGLASGLVALGAATVTRWNSALAWNAYHFLIAGGVLVAILSSACNHWAESGVRAWRLGLAGEQGKSVASGDFWLNAAKSARGWALVAGSAVMLFAMRGAEGDPSRPVWQFGASLLLVGAAAWIGWSSRHQFYAYTSVVVILAGTTLLCVGYPIAPRGWTFWTWSLSAAAVCGGGWLCADVWRQRRQGEELFAASLVPVVQRFVAAFGLCLYFLSVVLVTVSGFAVKSNQGLVSGPYGILTALLYGGLVCGLLWDTHSRLAVAGLYLWGLLVETIILDACRWNLPRGILGFGFVLAAHLALTGGLWKRSPFLVQLGAGWGIQSPLAGIERTRRWLPPVNNVVAIPAAVIAFGIVLGHPDRTLRVAAGFIPVLLAYGAASLAQRPRREWQQRLCLVWLACAAILIGWADMAPSGTALALLVRGIRLLMVLSTVAFFYQIVIPRWLSPENDWCVPLRRAALIAASAGLMALLAIMALEAGVFLTDQSRSVPINDLQLLAVSVVMIGLIAALLSAALSPEKDPFGLSERGRMCYVYGAQAGAGLLFAHVYLCRPLWFSGFLGPYWPYVIVAIAFAGVGVSELFRRQGQTVLAEPMQRTGSFLPLLPAIGMWLVASESNYSMLLFLVGGLYLYLSFTRKSLLAGIAAAVAGNGSLWRLLFDEGVAPLQQPQLWLVPPAVSALLAAELNKRRLSPTTLTAIRYAASLTIYLSSTGEMFIRGIGATLWPPLILLVLSLGGAFLGIVLRIRAFLYLGSIFVFLALCSMVVHASRAIHHTWPGWAFGIAVGLGILFLFGLFEKRRDEVRRLASDLKTWDR